VSSPERRWTLSIAKDNGVVYGIQTCADPDDPADGFEKVVVIPEQDAEQLREAVERASYALDPNQGERPDPVRAALWLRTTLPPEHPNYVDRAALKEKEKLDG
jgi:hypothetical protein